MGLYLPNVAAGGVVPVQIHPKQQTRHDDLVILPRRIDVIQNCMLVISTGVHRRVGEVAVIQPQLLHPPLGKALGFPVGWEMEPLWNA